MQEVIQSHFKPFRMTSLSFNLTASCLVLLAVCHWPLQPLLSASGRKPSLHKHRYDPAKFSQRPFRHTPRFWHSLTSDRERQTFLVRLHSCQLYLLKCPTFITFATIRYSLCVLRAHGSQNDLSHIFLRMRAKLFVSGYTCVFVCMYVCKYSDRNTLLPVLGIQVGRVYTHRIQQYSHTVR